MPNLLLSSVGQKKSLEQAVGDTVFSLYWAEGSIMGTEPSITYMVLDISKHNTNTNYSSYTPRRREVLPPFTNGETEAQNRGVTCTKGQTMSWKKNPRESWPLAQGLAHQTWLSSFNYVPPQYTAAFTLCSSGISKPDVTSLPGGGGARELLHLVPWWTGRRVTPYGPSLGPRDILPSHPPDTSAIESQLNCTELLLPAPPSTQAAPQ